MRTDIFHWRSLDNLLIYGKSWAPESEIKGIVCVVHGMGEHCGRYEFVGKYLCDNGIAVIANDNRGHGKSEGKRGHTPSYELLLQNVHNLTQKAKELFPECPLILYGHSMGANLILNYAMRKKPVLNGVIASSPWLRLAFEPPAIKVALARIMKNIYPAFSQSTELDTKAISRIPEEVKKYEEDPLVHDRITAMMFSSLYDAGLWALQHPQEMELPLLIFHGSGDRLTSHEATKEFAGKVKGDVTFRLFEGGYHELHNDLNREGVLALIEGWAKEHF
jgi:alpha-beta hydrolase superfamily lysophospholipase